MWTWKLSWFIGNRRESYFKDEKDEKGKDFMEHFEVLKGIEFSEFTVKGSWVD